MNITERKTTIRKLKPGDHGFIITDGIITSARAGMEITSGCPYNYREIIQKCIQHGWLKPVASVTEKEYVWMNLSE